MLHVLCFIIILDIQDILLCGKDFSFQKHIERIFDTCTRHVVSLLVLKTTQSVLLFVLKRGNLFDEV